MEIKKVRKENRKSIRVETKDCVANCRLLAVETGGRFQFTVWPIKNVSTGGLAIHSDEKISNGALAFLNIDLDTIMKTVGAIAKIIWCNEYDSGCTIGLNFSRWPKDMDKKLLADFIKEKLSCEELLYKNGDGNLKSA